MATPKKHIEPTADMIRRYLAGELDDKTMHALERQALEDPFLAEAIQGYGKSPHAQEPALNDLRARLQQRVAQPPITPTGAVRRIDRRWLAAASILLLIAISAVFLINRGPSVKDVAQEFPAAPKARDSATPLAPPAPAAAQPGTTQAIVANSASDQPSPQPEKKTVTASRKAKATRQRATEEKDRARSTDFHKTQPSRVAGDNTAEAAPALAAAPARTLTLPPPPPAATYGAGSVNKAKVTDTIYIGRKPSELMRKNLQSDDIASKTQGKVAGVESNYSSYHEAHDLRLISGKVLDASTGELMRGAIVHERSTNKRVMTDSAGQFAFTVKSAARTSLDVSLLGYKNTVVNVPENNNSLDIYLPTAENALSESILTGGTRGRAVPLPGLGQAAYRQYLDFLPPVPVAALRDSLSGEVRVTFLVYPDGSLHNVKADRPFHPAAGEAAVKRVEEGPKWVPVSGRKRKAEINVPVKLIPMK
ncbi:carboxypeptidase-like regulatory domain-containing protein [Chitinophaga rhizosphaerae]|uniref:carboxypeptidase-like regulatory domain-containing protein n=1 Tax=Chitinophaga rhizosphaerae TaxID=1864947 RepID=UPI000F8128AB|nr:carboxypeptidase-like regulatory domain-containing protein [Chitinophaga rhizosphaerae]